MELEKQFISAQERVTKLSEKPDNLTLLKLYALFKQGSLGDVSGTKPGLLDFVKKAKFEAWEALKGKTQAQAQQEYIQLVESLEK